MRRGGIRARLLAGVLLLVAALMFGLAACGDDDHTPPEVTRPDEVGQQLVTKYMTLLQQKDTAQLRTFLSDAFLIQRADGSWSTKDEYLKNLPEIREYTVQSITAKQDGPVLTVKWALEVDQTINGQLYRGDPAPRLSSFVWDGAEWHLASHANFNTPATATPTPASGR
ncbi:MAG: nuclear transport factor 2 family protein [Dehalococcoidia bacterium]